MDFATTFITQLAAAPPGEDVFNPYTGDTVAAERCRRNLHRYLSHMAGQEPVPLLVGEAPGYRGCRLTGIPFTSEQILRDHPWFGLSGGFSVGGNVREATATIVWQALDELSVRPLVWNVFPFHPHRPARPDSNRPPRAAEVRLGEPYLRALFGAFPVECVWSVGRTASAALASWGIPAISLRHPAHGGATQFRRHLAAALQERQATP